MLTPKWSAYPWEMSTSCFGMPNDILPQSSMEIAQNSLHDLEKSSPHMNENPKILNSQSLLYYNRSYNAVLRTIHLMPWSTTQCPVHNLRQYSPPRLSQLGWQSAFMPVRVRKHLLIIYEWYTPKWSTHPDRKSASCAKTPCDILLQSAIAIA